MPISQILSRIDSFPTLPVVANRVMEITSDPDSSPKDLFEVISRDQALTTTILKVANSPFFGVVKRVSSLRQAVPLLGFAEIRNVVLGKAVFNSFKTIKSETKLDLEAFWRHAFYCGLGAKVVTQGMGDKNNEVFVAGLIHDIGKLVVWVAAPELFDQVMRQTERQTLRTHRAELELLGMSHDEIGMKLLEKWMFPDQLVVAVGYHHRPLQNPLPHPVAVHLGDCLAHVANNDLRPDAREEILGDYFEPAIIKTAAECGITWNETVFRQYLDQVRFHIAEEQSTYEMLVS